MEAGVGLTGESAPAEGRMKFSAGIRRMVWRRRLRAAEPSSTVP
jgi:hypothetical protein